MTSRLTHQRMVEVVQNWKTQVGYQIMSIAVFIQHSYEKMIGVQSTGFRDQFVVVSSAPEVIYMSAYL